MKKKIILAAAVLAFAVFAMAYSYSGYGKNVSVNTSAEPDGTIHLCRKFSEINKVIAIDSNKKSHKKEVAAYKYNASTGELFVTEDLSDFTAPIFHVEGTPDDAAEFILWNMDLSQGPVGVFLNGKVCVENREYVLNESAKTITLKVSPKEVSSIAIVWHVKEGGLASVSEMTQKEADLYAEVEGAWITEIAKNKIAALTEYPTLDFSSGAKPKIVMKKYTQEQLRKELDEFPVNAYKIRHDFNMKKLSSEAGFKMNLPQKSGEYKIVSAMLIESSLKGELTKTLEFSYDKTDFFSLGSITVEASQTTGGGTFKSPEHSISTSTLEFKVPVKKEVYWSILNEGEKSYKPEVLCTYTWVQNGTLYKIQCLENQAQNIEAFIKGLL